MKSSFTADLFLSPILDRNISPMGMFIEAHITAEDSVFVTNNTREVERVEAVEVEDWTKKNS